MQRSGRGLLERCDKLLQSIAAFRGTEQDAAVDQQPSPVSVLDSSPYLGEEGSLSPLVQCSIDFKGKQNASRTWPRRAKNFSIDCGLPLFSADQLADDWEEERRWSSYEVGEIGEPEAMDPDYAYVCDVLRASELYGGASDAAYAALEDGRCRRRGGPARDPSKTARLHRRLVFDAVAEILDRKCHVAPWDVFARVDGEGEKALPRVWAEFQRVREQVAVAAAADDHEGAACGAVRNDIAAARPDGWVRPAAEMSDVVLQIERLIFKDLVAETTRDLGAREPLSLPSPPPQARLLKTEDKRNFARLMFV
ncbi:hypothetical protein BHE74_00050810 [Ensete ventricosum]|nr:hypothetical protein BHE74_00050810 [Ensete ventricosum]